LELVYLWVEHYKNIKKQGFNFSPRFECKFHDKYDENGNLLDDCELEIKPKEHIENFFAENINVTAIVGKNGSGKSSVFKCLKKYINNIYSSEEQLDDGISVMAIPKTEEKVLIVFYSKTRKTFYFQASFKFIHEEHMQEKPNLEDTSFPMFDYSFSQNRVDNHDVFPWKYKNAFNGISFNQENIRNISCIIQNYQFLKKNNQLEKFDKFFIPQKVVVNIDLQYLNQRYTSGRARFQNLQSDFVKLENKLMENMAIEEFLYELDKIDNKNHEKEKVFFKTPYFKILDFAKHENNYVKKTEEEGVYTIFEFEIDTLEYIQGEAYIEQGIEWDKGYLEYQDKLEELEAYVQENSYLKSLGRQFLEEIENSDFTLNILDKNNKSLTSLSFGEQQLVNILNNILTLGIRDNIIEANIDSTDAGSHIEKVMDNYWDLKLDNFIVFLDEIDIGFHPDWQKRIIQYITDFLQLLPNKNFHLVFSTHSPFLLSDIPKENIVFLDTYKEDDTEVEQKNQKVGNCKVLKHDEVLAKKQTFGANIHTLLSDSFFMDNGLMGEFAKKKINEIISNLKNDSYDPSEHEKQEIYKIIDSIGEPFLKEKLLSMYNEKYPKSNEDKIAELEIEIKRLKNDKNQV